MRRLAPLLLLLAGCGSSWSASDSKWAVDVVDTAATALELCAEDAGSCSAAQVRALERAQVCEASATLVRHKIPVPEDGGAMRGCRR